MKMALEDPALSRNAPCPCGSGKKYKHCCLGRPIAAAPGRRRILILVAAGLVLIGALVIGWQWGTRNGIFSAIIGLVVVGGSAIVRNAPRSRGRGGADRIDFGRSG